MRETSPQYCELQFNGQETVTFEVFPRDFAVGNTEGFVDLPALYVFAEQTGLSERTGKPAFRIVKAGETENLRQCLKEHQEEQDGTHVLVCCVEHLSRDERVEVMNRLVKRHSTTWDDFVDRRPGWFKT
ncbi:hypothetical protein [Desulfovibrio inopinatus]|uniref:hypothetical protein n=1 Tax=Desulfovibrio inopinatus TaxID=102109 RepID=UPI0004879F51|nr:hypothetical protein [Desulfovibrio inopinatus]